MLAIPCSQNRDLKCNRIFKLPVFSSCLGTFYGPYSSFLQFQFLHYLVLLYKGSLYVDCYLVNT